MTEHIPPLPPRDCESQEMGWSDTYSEEALVAYAKAYHAHHSKKDRELLEQARIALGPFSNYACTPACSCHNCAARATVVTITERLKEQST